MTHHDPTPQAKPWELEADTLEAHIACGNVTIIFKDINDFVKAVEKQHNALPILAHTFDPTTGLHSSSLEQIEQDKKYVGEITFAETEKDFTEIYQDIADSIGAVEGLDAKFIGEDDPSGISAVRFSDEGVDTYTIRLGTKIITDDIGTVVDSAPLLTIEADLEEVHDPGHSSLLYLMKVWGTIHSALLSAPPEIDTLEMIVPRFEPSAMGASLGFAFLLHNESAGLDIPLFDINHIDTDELAESYPFITDAHIATLIDYLVEVYRGNDLLTMADVVEGLDALTYELTGQPE
jgi:hypothetical protein